MYIYTTYPQIHLDLTLFFIYLSSFNDELSKTNCHSLFLTIYLMILIIYKFTQKTNIFLSNINLSFKIEEQAVDDLEMESGGEEIENENNSDEDYNPQEDGYRSSRYLHR